MDNFSIDAYTPKEIAARVEKVCISKTTTSPFKVFVLGILAGAFIALGAALYTSVIHDSQGVPLGLLKLIGGLSFCLGLVLVVVAGAELFTGNNLLVIACIDGKISPGQLLTNWLVVFVGNFLGALIIVALVYVSGLWQTGNGMLAEKVILLGAGKVELSFLEAFSRGVLCNLLVCLAVWLCFAGHTVTDKILAILFPITAFVALGFEHSVANMYFIPASIIAINDPVITQSISSDAILVQSSSLNFSGLLANLVPVTLGNIVGGSLFVGLVYYFLYVRD
ncbi:formate/nitrite transporter family protein [Aliikangiella sp. G2MR2-5]|uniref:formate/nitrite transporter family protein n=1 Tax=Aliikangiella sp. G2MR2-5 TaxID=2788943 RepID=UPI0018A982D7|nr:formate/nitrite transporter family protein [Aliikangiella sp. G2MR2-5]